MVDNKYILAAIYLVVMVLGISIFLSARNMKKTGNISTLFIHESEIIKIFKKEEFINRLYPKASLFGVFTFLYGLITFISKFWMDLGNIPAYMTFVFLVAVFWFSTELRKAKNECMH